MASSTIQIWLPESFTPYVEAQVESGAYGKPSDYVRELILEDRDRRLARLEDRLLQNLQSKPVAIKEAELAAEDFVALCRRKLSEIR